MSRNILIGLGVAVGAVLILGVLFKSKPQAPVPAPSVNANLANPASVNCGKQGGTTQIMDGPNGQYGLCVFDDNYACEEWAMMRGECPVGGVRTTGFDTTAQKYCAWVGGQTLAVPDAQCTLPNGKVCPDEALYNGECEAN